MKINTKRLIAITALILIFAAITGVIVGVKLTNGVTEAETEAFDPSEELPYAPERDEEAETFDSYQEAFAEVIQKKIYVLRAAGEGSEAEVGINSVYVSEGSVTPTAVVTYTNKNGKLCYMLLKLIDGALYTVDEEAPFDAVSAANDILIYSDCDIIALRSGIDSETGEQVIFDLYEGNFLAVKSKNYENASLQAMDETVSEYNAEAISFDSFEAASVSDGIVEYLTEKLGTAIELAE